MNLRRLKFCTSKVGSGKTPRGGAAVYVSNGVMLLRSQNVHFDGLRLDDVVFISDEADQEMSNSRVQPLDVLLNITGASLGRCTVAPTNIEEANVNQHVAILRCKHESMLPRFLCYSLQSAPVQNQIWATENGSSREGLNFEQIGDFPLPDTKLSEQQLITDYLDRETAEIDELIREKEGMLTLLEEKRAALISHLVTRGVNAKVTLKDSGLDWLPQVPKNWLIRRCATLFTDRDERGDPSLPLLVVSLNTGVTLRSFESDRIEAVAEDFNSYKIAKKNDLVFNKMRFWQGAVGIAPEDGLTSPDYTVAAISPLLMPRYVELLFRIRIFNAEVKRYSHGMVDDRLRLYWDEFKAIQIPVPPLEEQLAIVDEIQRERERSFVLESALGDSITLLKERRAALITAAVTGQIAIPVLIT